MKSTEKNAQLRQEKVGRSGEIALEQENGELTDHELGTITGGRSMATRGDFLLEKIKPVPDEEGKPEGACL